MISNLVIVESPAKCKTIMKYLKEMPGKWEVLASYGHVMDLPPKKTSIDVDNNFEMKYELIERNKGHVNMIYLAAKHADVIWLASDLDREGSMISWSIVKILKERGLTDKTYHRITFAEITPKAIQYAINHPTEIDMNQVNAQQARRALDFLVGFNLSPVLWSKVQRGLSAGRVQSPALRLIVERAKEIEAFKPDEYWSIEAQLQKGKDQFKTKLVEYAGKKVKQFTFVDKAGSDKAVQALQKACKGKLVVGGVTEKKTSRKPPAPFITSTLQQAAANRLGMSTKDTMMIAQKLYEGVSINGEMKGLISYMRTDATALSEDAINDIRSSIVSTYGKENLYPSVRKYASKSKNAQEAHEAIRPASMSMTPKVVRRYLNSKQHRLYDLIYRRAQACQMADAILNTTSITFPVDNTDDGKASFRTSGTTVVFPGFYLAFPAKDKDNVLPVLKQGDIVDINELGGIQHFTEPPPKYSEASLVKTMEEMGIGRPSTYASIIGVLKARNYVEVKNKRFHPTDVGEAVSDFLTEHFAQYVDYDFTAKLEDELDAVSRGEKKWIPLLEEFWNKFHALVEDKMKSADRNKSRKIHQLGTHPDTGKPIGVGIGKYGPYVYMGDRDNKDEKLVFANPPPNTHVNQITLEQAIEAFSYPKTLGEDDKGNAVTLNRGRYGFYVKCNNVVSSLKFAGLEPDEVDLAVANRLIAERIQAIKDREIKTLGKKIKVLKGNYGPFVTDGKKNASIPKDQDPEKITLEQARALLKEAKARKVNKGSRKGNRKPKNDKSPKVKQKGWKDNLPM